MSGRPAKIRSRDLKAIIKAARQQGVKEVLVKTDGSVVILLAADDRPDEPTEPDVSGTSSI